MSTLTEAHYHDEEAAYRFVESRLWPNGPVCPHCGETERISAMKGKSTRIGAYKCYACRKPFTVKIGTIFEASKVPMHLWLQAMYLMCASKKGISSNQLHRTLGVQLRTGWFMSHRIREAMRSGSLAPMGSAGSIVEADETYIGQRKGIPKAKAGYGHKLAVLTLVDRGGEVRSFHVEDARARNVVPIIRRNIAREASLVTDEFRTYITVGKTFARHERLKHKIEEWARGELHERR